MKKVEVLGAIYPVIEYSEVLPEDEDGQCCPEDHEIRLKKSIRDSETLIHEVGHAILFEGGLFCALDEKLREVIVQQYAQVLSKNFYIRFKK
jgi:hypothetical protein